MLNKDLIELLKTMDEEAEIVCPYDDASMFTFNPVERGNIIEFKIRIKNKELSYICLDVEDRLKLE